MSVTRQDIDTLTAILDDVLDGSGEEEDDSEEPTGDSAHARKGVKTE